MEGHLSREDTYGHIKNNPLGNLFRYAERLPEHSLAIPFGVGNFTATCILVSICAGC